MKTQKNLNVTAFVDSVANVSLLSERAPANKLTPQLSPKQLSNPPVHKCSPQKPWRYYYLNYLKQPEKRTKHQVSSTTCYRYFPLCDAGCDVLFHNKCCEIVFYGENLSEDGATWNQICGEPPFEMREDQTSSHPTIAKLPAEPCLSQNFLQTTSMNARTPPNSSNSTMPL